MKRWRISYCILKLKRLVDHNRICRIDMQPLRQIFHGAFMAIINYETKLFEEKLKYVRIRNRLESRTTVGVYVTTSSEDLAVLANIPPINLHLMELIDTKNLGLTWI